MNCPICNFEVLSDEKICPNCNRNISVQLNCIKSSTKLYNNAILLANKREYSNAINSLKKSILYNKENVLARNLLGLIYYKIGYLADAMKQWIISTNLDENKENRAFEYLEIIRKNMRKFETQNDAIHLYNQAIKYLKRKNDDIAIIRLKNALKILPDFIEAMNLLAFCYIVQGKNKKALDMANNVLKVDNNNKKALYYIKEIYAKDCLKKNLLDETYNFYGKVETIQDKNDNENKSNFRVFYNFFLVAITAVFTALIIYFLFIPNYKQQYDEEIKKINKENDMKLKEQENKIQELNEQIKTINEENKTLQRQIKLNQQ